MYYVIEGLSRINCAAAEPLPGLLGLQGAALPPAPHLLSHKRNYIVLLLSRTSAPEHPLSSWPASANSFYCLLPRPGRAFPSGDFSLENGLAPPEAGLRTGTVGTQPPDTRADTRCAASGKLQIEICAGKPVLYHVISQAIAADD